MFLTVETDIINTILSAISTVTVLIASFLIPVLVKKYNDKKQKVDAGEQALLDAFEKYFSEDFAKNDFEWYLAELSAIVKKYEIKFITCSHCKKRCTARKYIHWFEKIEKKTPEINNFTFKVGKTGFKINLSTLYCYKCEENKAPKKAITK